MKINRRQTVLLFELISSKKPLSYAFFQNYFGVCRRTLHEDVKRLNDVLNEKHSVKIHYQNGRGFSLEYSNEESLDILKNELMSKFSDSWEIENDMAEYYCQILAYFIMRQSYGKLDELSSLLNLNSRSTTNLLSEIRKKLERYKLSITVRPHYGLKLSGQEKHIRYCVMDIIYRYNTEWENSGYDMNPQEKESLASLCAEYIKEAKVELSSTAVDKLVYLMMISRYRSMHDHSLILSKTEKEVVSKLSDVIKCEMLTDKLEKYYQCKLPEDEKVFYGIYLLTHVESFHQNPVIQSMSNPLLTDVLDYLEEFGICAPGGSRNSWEYFLKHLVRQSVLMDAFDVFERSPNSTMKKAVKNTPLAVTVGDLICGYLEKRLHRSLGEAFYLNVVLAAYSCIRNTQNTRRMNSIAIVTPLDKRYGESLKRRVTDRYSNIIKNIEVMSNAECIPERLVGFDTLLYCGNLAPSIMSLPIHKMEVDYFFTKEDSEQFYENIVVPSRIYRKAFGQLHKKDYLHDVLFTSLEDLIKTQIQPFCSEEVLKQMKGYEINEYVVNNRTMNILLFVKEEKDTFSKLIQLRHIASVNDTQFTRIFIHAVKLDGDLIKLKTTEKVVRNLTSFRDTDYDILNFSEIDFYDYYIYNKKTRLK